MRSAPLATRANVATFGTFGYELDLGRLSAAELDEVHRQVAWFKRYREILHTGDFHRLIAPYGNEKAAWMVVSRDRHTAIVGDYRLLITPNGAFTRLALRGLDAGLTYKVDCTGASSIAGRSFTGAELMRIGLVDSDASCGQMDDVNPLGVTTDFSSRLFVLTAD